MKKLHSFIKHLVAILLGTALVGMSVYAVQIPTSLNNALQYIMETVWTSNGTSSGTVNVDISTGGIYIATGFLQNGTGRNSKALGVDASGNVVYVTANAISNPLLFPTANYIPKINPTQNGLDVSTMYQIGGLIGVNTQTPVKSVDILGDFQVTTQGSSVTYQYNFFQTSATPILLSILQTQQCGCDTTLTGANCNAPFAATVGDTLFCVDVTSQDTGNSSNYFYNIYQKQQIGVSEAVLVTSGNRVGVRTYNPQSALDVSGDVRIATVPAGNGTMPLLVLGTNNTVSQVSPSIFGASPWMVGSGQYSVQLIGNGTNKSVGLYSVVGGTNNVATGYISFIGGGAGNTTFGQYSTVGGGSGNSAYGTWSSVLGGYENQSLANYGFIGGGFRNNIAVGSQAGAIVGGQNNSIQGANNNPVIVGGQNNSILGNANSFIGGGSGNVISSLASYSVIPGGKNNQVSGSNSFAGGQGAQALDDNTFVWNNTGTFASTASGQFLINAYGGVGINTNTSLYTFLGTQFAGGLTVNGWIMSNYSMYSRGISVYNFQNTGLMDMISDPSGQMIYQTGATPAVIIQGNGGGLFSASTVNVVINPYGGGRGGPQANVGIGFINPLYKLHVNGTIASPNPFLQTSDGTYKTNEAPITDALTKISALQGISYKWDLEKAGEINFDNRTHLGFIAQDVQAIIPEAIYQDSEGHYAMDYSSIIPVLVQAMKEQQIQITNLQAQIDVLTQYNVSNP